MHLEDTASCVNQWECTLNLIGGTQDRRYNPLIGEGGFHQTIKIRCDDNSDKPPYSQRRGSAVCRSWLFLAVLAFLVIRF